MTLAARGPNGHASEAYPVTIVIASRQRSGSTFLGKSLCEHIRNVSTPREGDISSTACWFIDEPWFDAGVRPENREYEAMVPWSPTQRLQDPFGYIQKLRLAYCHQRLHPSTHGKGRCNFPMVVKLFDIHYEYSDLRRPNPSLLRPLFSAPSSRVVVLERDPSTQRCSLLWAYKSHDWWLPDTPDSSRKAYETFKRNTCASASASPEEKTFAKQHEQWYAMIREALHSAPGASRRSMNVTYDENTKRHTAVLERITNQLLV